MSSCIPTSPASRCIRNLVALAAVSAFGSPVSGQSCGGCPNADLNVFVCNLAEIPASSNPSCAPGAETQNCRTPVVIVQPLEVVAEGGGLLTARLPVRFETLGNTLITPNGRLNLFWNQGPPVSLSTSLCENNTTDVTRTYLERTHLSCQGAPYDFGVFSVRGLVCAGSSCQRSADAANLPFRVTASDLGCPEPPLFGCNDDASCTTCIALGGGGCGASLSIAGEGAAVTPCQGGPGALLRYRAGGAGTMSLPGSGSWNVSLGRNWSHDYAERLVTDPLGDNSHVWLITRFATFREFRDLNGDNLYEKILPSDERRTLVRLPGTGWQLQELDGAVQEFDTSGRWLRNTDRNGNTKSAFYGASGLDHVNFPDGRKEEFVYAGGLLSAITEVGVDGIRRTWGYTWSGLDLQRITRPDGTKWEFFYGDLDHPGFLTRMDLVGTDGSRRVEAAYRYDARGNVLEMWRGALASTDPLAVERWQLVYDNPVRPTRTEATDALGVTSVYTIGRDVAGSAKPKVLQIQGDCPTCGTGPNSTFEYTDSANPLRATVVTSGRGLRTEMDYDGFGMLLRRREAVNTPKQRETVYTYSPSFRALVTSIAKPSTSGGVAQRTATYLLDPQGNPTTSRTQGIEAGSAFLFDTVTTYNSAGQPLSIDPPGYATADQTTFTYNFANRNGLIADSRTDPLDLGKTRFEIDGWNRRTRVVDPNGVGTTTVLDDLNRVRSVRQEGSGATPDLITTSTYNGFGDLIRMTLPRGNVIEYGYDAVGRLTSVERKPDEATPRERTLYTLDAVGHRTREDRQRWTGTSWETRSTTSFDYSTRCHLDRARFPDGSATEYRYDCDGNLTETWDANHPISAHPTPTMRYDYDPLNRLTSVTQPWEGTGSAVTKYDYDVQDHLVAVTDANQNPTTSTYSDRDLMTSESSIVTAVATYAYNAHGELVEETDARPVTMTRTMDAADRVTRISYPDPMLETTYSYGTTPTSFDVGRLISIDRPEVKVDYAYDRFGRLIQDGAMSYQLDANGNRQTLTYPNAVQVQLAFDFADRPLGAVLINGANPPQPLAGAAAYEPFGPLASLALGNGLTETRTFDQRFFPQSIVVPGRLSWTYVQDKVGNPLAITDALVPANSRTFTYQDPQYFLRGSTGPWGTETFTYDKIGNRLTEGGNPYLYRLNAGGGNTPVLLSRGGLTYAYDSIGNATSINSTPIAYGDDRKMHALGKTRSALYDGRGFLANFSFSKYGPIAVPADTSAVYGSEGRLYARTDRDDFEGTDTTAFVFYFGDRPLATLEKGTIIRLLYLTTDHLGTPALATTGTGGLAWRGVFRSFGGDDTGAQAAGVFLRFPGQWQDDNWLGLGKFELSHNVHRWYEVGVGRYTTPDPVSSVGAKKAFSYADSSPLLHIDPLGLFTVDPSCDCERQLSDNIPLGLAKATQWARSPACSGALDKFPEVKSCVARRFSPIEQGREPNIRCHSTPPPEGSFCGSYTPRLLTAPATIHLFPGGSFCPRFIPQLGIGSTIFHEVLHSCGLLSESEVAEVTLKCTGFSAR